MKRVRINLVFEEVNDDFEVIQSEPPRGLSFGAVTGEHFGTPEQIAKKLGDRVAETINQFFPAYLEGKK